MATADPEVARRAAHAILARPEFSSVHPSVLERIRSWIGHQLGRVLEGGFRGISALGVVFLVIVGVALVVLVVLTVRTLSRDPRVTEVEVGVAGRPAADWLAEAEACERRNDFRGALRARYRALVADLARRGLVDEVPGRTAGEYRRAVADALPPAAGSFAEATDLFEGAVYGDRRPGAPEAAHISALADRVLAAAR